MKQERDQLAERVRQRNADLECAKDDLAAAIEECEAAFRCISDIVSKFYMTNVFQEGHQGV